MASATGKKACVKCPKGPGQVLCDGCEQYFCMKHLLEHRQELVQQMSDITEEHNRLRKNLISEERNDQHPLIIRVDRWESKSIEKIKQVANEVRLELRRSLDDMKKNFDKSLRQIADELEENREMDTYTEIDLVKWMSQLRELKEQMEKPSTINLKHDQDGASSTHLPLIRLVFAEERKVSSQIANTSKWTKNGQTVAGGHGQGDALNQLHYPYAFDLDRDGTILIADHMNDRIMKWVRNARQGEIIAGGNDQLSEPGAVLIDRIDRSLIISDCGNRRVMRWRLDKQNNDLGQGEVIMLNIQSYGLAMDDEGSLYVSDEENHEVRRYGRQDGRLGVIVAGGNGQGNAFNQLDRPRNIFVDADLSVYVSDTWNHRVMKWMRNAREGFVVAGGQGKGTGLEQLCWPRGISVDQNGSVYVADQCNHRIMRWLKGGREGEVIVGENGEGENDNQLTGPASISFDRQGNLYVVDQNNHRIQLFQLE